MSAIPQHQITAFLKLLVEFGNVYKVDANNTIIGPDNAPVMILVNKKPLPIRLMHENMMQGEWVYLNPFIETLTHSGERSWFWQSRSMIVGYLLHRMLVTLVENLAKSSEDANFNSLDISRQLIDNIDDKTATNIEQIKPEQFGAIVYERKARSASFVSALFNTDVRTKLSKRVRKKDWAVIDSFFSYVFQTENPNDAIKVSSTIIGMPEADATLNVLVKIAEFIAPYCAAILNVTIPVEELQMHIPLLAQYHKLTAWYQVASKKDTPQTVLPWNTPPPNIIPQGGSVMPAAAVAPVKMITHVLPSVSVPHVSQVLPNVARQQPGGLPIIPRQGSVGLLPMVPATPSITTIRPVGMY